MLFYKKGRPNGKGLARIFCSISYEHGTYFLILRCKAISGRILGVGAAWLGTQPITYSRARISWDKTKGHATHRYILS